MPAPPLLVPILARISAAAGVLLLLGGCYLPARFDAEIEISRYGAYTMIFDGYMAKVELYNDLKKGAVTPAGEREKAEAIRRDLERDTAASAFRYVGKGHFNIHWERSGDLFKAKMVTFLRRNEALLSLSYVKTSGRIVIEGRALGPDARKRLHAAGLGMEGEMRVISDARVISHNATSVTDTKGRDPGTKTYTWKIKSIFDPTPKLTITVR